MKKHSTFKAALAAVLAALMAFAAFPVSALPLNAAEKNGITPYWTVPEGYDEHDYNAIVSFLEIEDENGVKNGTKFCESYDPNDPTTWGEPEEPYEDEEYPEPIEGGYEDPYWYIGDFGFNEGTLSSFKSWNRDLVGFLDLSGCARLETVWIEDSRITGIDVSDCYELFELFCDNNRIESLNLSGCQSLSELSCSNNMIKQLDLSDTCFDYSFVVEGDGYVSMSYWDSVMFLHYAYAQSICGAEFYGFFNSAGEQLEADEYSDHCFLIEDASGYDDYDDEWHENSHEVITLRFAEPTYHETEWWVPFRYHPGDYTKLVNFLESKSENGVKYGEMLHPNYDPSRPNTWGTLDEYDQNRVVWVEEDRPDPDDTYIDDYGHDHRVKLLRADKINFNYVGSQTHTGTLDFSDFSLLTQLDCSVASVDGLILTGCVNLDSLYCYGNNLTELDISDCVNLTHLGCFRNELTELDLENCTKLRSLDCGYNKITELDLSIFPELRTLKCEGNAIEALDLTGNSKLNCLECNKNNIRSLDLTDLTQLSRIECCKNPITELDLSGNPKLPHDLVKAEGDGSIGYEFSSSSGKAYAAPAEGATFAGFFNEEGELLSEGIYSETDDNYYFRFNSSASGTVIARFKDAEEETVPAGYNEHDYNAIVSFLEMEDENGVKNGEKLSESYDPMDPETWGTTAFDYTFDEEQLGEMPCVEWQSVDGEKRLVSVTLPTDSMITFSGALDLSGCEQLRFLCCDHTQIEGLDVSGCTALKELHCQFNFMSMLNIDGAVSLEYLNCSFNSLYELDFTGFSELKVLICDECELNSLKVTGLSKLIELSCCAANFITELDVTGCTALRVLECHDIDIRLSELDLSDCSDLLRLNVSGAFAELDLSNCGYLLLDRVEARGDGLITQYYENRLAWSNDDYYNIGMDEIEMNNEMAEISICAMPPSGATFEGFYDENGNFISEGELNEDYVYDPEANDFVMGEYYVLNLDEFPEYTTVIARFSGYEEEPTPGDVDGDGEVTALDALSIMRLLVSETDGSDMNVDAADMNGDGVVDILDALLALRMAIGAV